MKAITVEPLKPGTARLDDVPEPDVRDGSVVVEAIAVGVCGTDVEIVEGKYGWAPQGKPRLVLGHESLGRVLDPGVASGLQKGDLVVGIVRNLRHLGPESPPRQECYIPLEQSGAISADLVMRTSGDPLSVLPAVKAAIWSVNTLPAASPMATT